MGAIREMIVDYLPMDCVAVDRDGDAFQPTRLAKTLDEHKDGGCLRIKEPRLVTDNDVVQYDVDIRDFKGVER